MISAKIIADSVNPVGCRLTTFVLKYPRFVHSELMTHRVLSRNSASSRAIPIWKMINAAVTETAMPIHWGSNGKGMQAKGEVSNSRKWVAKLIWKMACFSAITFAWLLSKVGIHKQVANRLIEPFSHMTVIVSATEWGNFFNLRAHPDAQPEFQELAYKMLEAYMLSEPCQLSAGEWHLPFADKYKTEGLSDAQLKKITVARCARVSYLNFEGEIDHVKDYKLHDDLVASGHFSPTEHVAMATSTYSHSGNFTGFMQYRKTLALENKNKFDPTTILAKRFS